MAREDGCTRRFTNRTYRAVGIVVNVGLRSKLQIERGYCAKPVRVVAPRA
jgi:hypothetical protein